MKTALYFNTMTGRRGLLVECIKKEALIKFEKVVSRARGMAGCYAVKVYKYAASSDADYICRVKPRHYRVYAIDINGNEIWGSANIYISSAGTK